MERKVKKRRGGRGSQRKGHRRGLAAVVVVAVVVVVLLIGVGACVLLPFMTGTTTTYIYVSPEDTTLAAVTAQVDTVAPLPARQGLRLLAAVTGYGHHPRQGRYAAAPGESTLTVFRRMRNGTQAPVRLTIPSVRTKQRLAAYLGRCLMTDSASLCRVMTDSVVCRQYGCDTLTVISLFLPDTYEVFWDISPDKLLERMAAESAHFWQGEREDKARELGLTPTEVVILAGIVEEETNNSSEKPTVAGMYYNRLLAGMPLQADPTVKYALGDFSLRRIRRGMLTVDSPYNTYINTGLPPGPIRIATKESIDAVLNMERHDYIYMCAKEDFSGTHNFAVTYAEHLANARRYAAALDRRGIR